MTEYVVRHFEWDRRGVAFPPSPLPKDFQVVCPSYELVVAEEAAEHFKLPELPQVIFYAMLLKEAERLGVLHRRELRTLESALIELRWSTFVSWVWLKEWYNGRQRTLDTPLSPFIMAFPPLHDTREMADYVIFYTMLLNEAVELGVVHAFMADGLKSSLVGQNFRLQEPRGGVGMAGCSLGGCNPLDISAVEYVRDNLRWSMRESSSLRPNLLYLHFMAYCPRFGHIVAMQFAYAAHIPEMVQAIFYAMVINDAAELRLIRRETGESLMLDLQKLRWDIIEA
ncbi:hypothetical protein Cgig2_022582 [Carnegiea gigantea]|uniref:Uncharacterized protein n=1 Tax=Carnegiea gigantea TaxID=171969 RepID=A0A9Q1QJZ7_9CARY|nr:hypothetical protein Cgig2_022582 [Carnegiea gigantea]